jgi:hypothetical protein
MLKRLGLIGFIIGILLLVGYIMNIVKFVKCDFEAPYKAEIIYGIGIGTGLGGVIGWININDEPKVPAPAE